MEKDRTIAKETVKKFQQESEETASKFQLEVKRLQKQLEDLRLATAKEKEAALHEACEENEHGFNRALAQVQVLYPELDLSGTGFYKDIVDGQVVEVDD